MNGIRSLNAGAPDLRLSGDQTQRGSYVQRRRAQMAGGGIMGSNAGSMLVAPTADGSRPGYGWLGDAWDWTKEKVGKVIPNELKNPAVLATLGGIGLNQFGLPKIPGMGAIGLEKGMGKNWLGDLLGNIMPGDTQFNTVLGDDRSFLGNYTGAFPDAYAGGNMPDYGPFTIGGGIGGASKLPGMIAGPVEGILGADRGKFAQLQNLATDAAKKNKYLEYAKNFGKTFLGDTTRTGQEPFNWKIPVAGGLAAGAYTAGQPRDVHPEDTTGINFQTGAQAMADPTQRFKPKAEYANVAEGGRIGYDIGGEVEIPEIDNEDIIKKLEDFIEKKKKYDDAIMRAPKQEASQGGRIGYKDAGDVGDTRMAKMDMIALEFEQEHGYDMMLANPELREWYINKWMQENFYDKSEAPGEKRVMAQEGGLMDLGGMEKDYRQEGGFVPLGGEEKADDVPARLSKNEFVFTADAVRNAGGGDIDAGAEVMENLMEHLEAGGEVSEDSQGLEGARGMFANAQQLEKRII